jgi:hypothetical protein
MSKNDLKIELGFKKYPARHTCDGQDISPAITIVGLTAPYFAMIMDDPDAPSGTFTHWIIWNIPSRDKVPEKISNAAHPPELPGSTQGTNTGDEIGYMGPCPPGGEHRYYLKVYGLTGPIDLRAGASKEELELAMKGKVSQYGEAMATYARP